MTIKLYYHPLSVPSRAVLFLIKMHKIEVEKIFVDLFQQEHTKPEFLKVNRFGMVPVIVDDGFHLGESRAIMKYLLAKYSPDSALYPKDPQKRALVDSMLDFDLDCFFSKFARKLMTILSTGKEESKDSIDRCKDSLQCMDDILENRKYAAGDHLTLADISIVHSLSLADIIDEDLSSYTRLFAYLKRIKEELGPDYNEVSDDSVEKFRVLIRSKRTT